MAAHAITKREIIKFDTAWAKLWAPWCRFWAAVFQLIAAFLKMQKAPANTSRALS